MEATLDIAAHHHLEESPQQLLHRIFGFKDFRPLQETIINNCIQGLDNFVLMPTGGGKSLCYQIPALVRPGIGIVVSPLISLMQDQVQSLQANGVAAAYYNSSLGSTQARQVLAQLHQGELDLLYVAPERLLQPSFLDRLHEIDVALFAIDEAHCVSQWGPDFRPEYIQIGQLRQLFPHVPMIALTATADKQTRADIRKYLHLERAAFHLASFNRPNIRYTVLEKHKPFQQLSTFLQTKTQESGIVYCMTRKRVEEVASKLQDQGYIAAPYHAGLSSQEKKQSQEAFQRDDIQIIVATIAFGMGIDKPNVRFVVHYDLPKNIESYYQETGRAGRDGLSAEALLLYGLGDIAVMRGIIEQHTDETHRRIQLNKLSAITSFAEAQTCRRRVLLNYFSEDQEKDCGNCDVCLNPPHHFDATDAARKALSCVYRVNQYFGVAHVVDVLRGANKERIHSLHHDKLSTYGIGKEYSQEAWYSIFRQLIHLGYLEQEFANYSVLKLTPKARPILRGEEQLTLAEPRVKTSFAKKANAKTKKTGIENYDEDCFQALRQLRKQLADDASVPPFVIFSDASLIEMSSNKPENDDAFLSINGVGLKKLASYGELFMQVIKQF